MVPKRLQIIQWKLYSFVYQTYNRSFLYSINIIENKEKLLVAFRATTQKLL
jgi:hypothetical protein